MNTEMMNGNYPDGLANEVGSYILGTDSPTFHIPGGGNPLLPQGYRVGGFDLGPRVVNPAQSLNRLPQNGPLPFFQNSNPMNQLVAPISNRRPNILPQGDMNGGAFALGYNPGPTPQKPNYPIYSQLTNPLSMVSGPDGQTDNSYLAPPVPNMAISNDAFNFNGQ